jgi:glycosyltransferase involved in cell wall biosynthesis
MLNELTSLGFDCVSTECVSDTEARIRWILEQLRHSPPDVFVPNLMTPAWFAARWLKVAGIPSIGVMHSDDAFYRGLCEVFISNKSPFRLSHAVGVSRVIETQLKEAGGQTRVLRVPYGVPLPTSVVQPKDGRMRLAYVGRFVEEQKRISEHARAICSALRKIPGTSAVFYGDGPDRENLMSVLEIEGRGLPVHIGGRVASQEIQEKLLECDVLVLLSDYEGLPIALLEAMACGCVPVCLSMRSGIPELVEDGVTGLLVENRGEDFIEAIRHLSQQPTLWSRLSAAARMKIESDFSVDVCNQRWADLLLEVAPAEPPRPINIPSKVGLPPVHPALAAEDYRYPDIPMALRCWRGFRKVAGRLRRKILPLV